MLKLKRILAITLFLGCAGAFYYCCIWLQPKLDMPIRVVTVSEQLNYIDNENLKSLLSSHIEKGFFGLNIRSIANDLKKIPWVERAAVTRQWPDMLKINIVERKPLAKLNKTALIDVNGVIFNPENIDNIQIPVEFYGDLQFSSLIFDTYKSINLSIKPLGLSVARLELMPDQGWKSQLSNGTTIMLGRNYLQERINRFVLAYPLVVPLDKVHKVVVDLRYTNGIAVAGKN